MKYRRGKRVLFMTTPAPGSRAEKWEERAAVQEYKPRPIGGKLFKKEKRHAKK